MLIYTLFSSGKTLQISFLLQADINSREYLRVNFKPSEPPDRGE